MTTSKNPTRDRQTPAWLARIRARSAWSSGLFVAPRLSSYGWQSNAQLLSLFEDLIFSALSASLREKLKRTAGKVTTE